MSQPIRGYEVGSKEYKRIILSFFLAGIATFALLYNLQPLLPMLSHDFHISADQASLSVSAATFGIAVALLFAGPLSDHFGRRPVVVISLFCSSIMALLIPFAPTWHLLLVLRVLQGAALAGLPAVAVVYLAEELIPKAQTRAAGVYIGGNAIGGMSGRLIAGFLADFIGWKWALFTMGVMAFICAIAVFFLLPKQRNFRPASLRLKQLYHATSQVLHDPVIVGLYAVGAAILGANVGLFNVIGYYVKQEYNFSSAAIALLFLTYMVGSFASTTASRRAAISGQRTVLPWSIVIMIVGTALMFVPWLWVIIIGLTLATAGFFAGHGVASGWVALRGKANGGGITGQAAAGYSFSYYCGSSLFGYLIGHMWAWGWNAAVGLALVLAIFALAISLLLKRTRSKADQLDDM